MSDQADQNFATALVRGDSKAVAGLLDEQFNWINGFGRVMTKTRSAREGAAWR